MISLAKGLAEVLPHYVSPNGGMVQVLLNSASSAEAHLALIALRDDVPERSLVTMVNVREVLRELPACPRPIPLEVEALAKIAGYAPVKNSFSCAFADAGGEYEIVFLGQGNLLYDIVISAENEKVFWSPTPRSQEIVTEKALDKVMLHDTLLSNVIDLAKEMGVVFQPKFYLSLEDWLLEYAEDSLRGISELF
ncbi:MAG: hypothetical protein IBX62_09475 [Coriobacteriia bacterium]|nr:hypothetical protein [Coriobacteriia bacterium]